MSAFRRLTGTNSTGQQLLSQVLVTAVGENKPGRLTLKINEFTVPVSGVPITIARRYDSLERNISGDFGFGWALDVYAVRLEAAPDHDVTITDPNTGRRVSFDFAPRSFGGLMSFLFEPKYAAEPGFYGALTSDGCGLMYFAGRQFRCALDTAYQPTTYTYTDPYGRRFTMGADGKLRSLRDLHGNTLTVTPTGITSSAGNRAVAFVRDAQGRITRITDPANRVYQYGYNAAGELQNVTLPGVATQPAYTYGSGHYLLTAKDARGNTEATLTYHPDGRLATMRDAVGNTTSYSYNLTGGTLTLPFAGGGSSAVADANGESMAKQPKPATASSAATTIIYASATTVTYPDTGVNTMYYDGYGMLLAETDALNKTSTFTYDANHQMLTETNALGQTTTYTYDAQGNPTSITDAGGNTISGAYNQYGLPVTDTNALGATRTILYDAEFSPIELRDSLGTLARFTFDSHGNPISFTDGAGGTTAYSYDQFGNLIAESDPLNHTHHWNYDDMGRPTKHVLPVGNEEFFAYNPLGHQTRYSRGGYFIDYENDANGNRTAQTDPLNHRTVYQYDAANRLEKTIYPNGQTQQFTYNHRDQVTSVTDESNFTTVYSYDTEGRLLRVTHPDGKFIAATYDATGRMTSLTDERGYTTSYAYDPDCDCRDRLTTITDARGKVTRYVYDNAGRRTSFIDANSKETKYEYDARHRLIKMIFPDTTTEQYGYDLANRLITATDEAGKVTRSEYDLTGNLLKVIDARNKVTEYRYDPNHNLTRVTDPRGDATAYSYTGLDEPATRSMVGVNPEYFGYDGARNLKTRQYGTGQITTYNYDERDRLTSIVPHAALNEPTISFTYTPTGERQTMTDGSGTTVYGYDTTGRHCLMGKQTPQGTLAYDWDEALNLKAVRSSNAGGVSVDYTYDELGRLETVKDNRITPGVTTYSYDNVGNLLKETRPNGVVSDYVYDSTNLLTGLTLKKGAATLASYTYGHKPTGQRESVIEQGGRTVNYGYDDVYRLTSETISGAPVAAQNGAVGYTHDDVGNRLTRTSTLAGLGNQSFGYHGGNKVVGDGYDVNGNTTAAAGQTYAYDFEDRLKRANNGAVTVVYDGDGNQVAKTVGGVTTKYLVDEFNPTGYAQVMEETVGGNVQRVYTHGLGILNQNRLVSGSWQTNFYGADGGAHVRLLTDAAGVVTDTFDYDAFGNLIGRTGATPNNYLYRGEQFDSDLGSYYLRARYYDQTRGRFKTTDPFPGGTDNPTTLHKYLYASADPVNLVDPLGLATAHETSTARASISARVKSAIDNLSKQIACVAIQQASEIVQSAHPALELAAQTGIFELAACQCKGGGKNGGGSKGTGGKGKNRNNDDDEDDDEDDGGSRGSGACGGACGDKTCFVAGTKVKTPKGEANIEDIKIGDEVFAANPESDKWQGVSVQKVAQTFIRTAPVVLDIEIGNEVITATPEHPFWVAGQGWIEARQLVRGSPLLMTDGRTVHVSQIRQREGNFEVFNLEVENLHTYFVSALGVWVHNQYADHHTIPKYTGGNRKQPEYAHLPSGLHTDLHNRLRDIYSGSRSSR